MLATVAERSLALSPHIYSTHTWIAHTKLITISGVAHDFIFFFISYGVCLCAFILGPSISPWPLGHRSPRTCAHNRCKAKEQFHRHRKHVRMEESAIELNYRGAAQFRWGLYLIRNDAYRTTDPPVTAQQTHFTCIIVSANYKWPHHSYEKYTHTRHTRRCM